MARQKAPNSKLSFDGLGLEPYEDEILLKLLKEKDIPMRQLKRQLVRQWIKENRPR